MKFEQKIVKENFGIGYSISTGFKKKFGINTRKSPFFLTKKLKEEISFKIDKLVIGKELKDIIKLNIAFKKKIKVYKSSIIKIKNDNKKKISKKK